MSTTVEFTIDGKTMTAEQGETILQVAEKNGITIPTLCYNKKVSKTTSCGVRIVSRNPLVSTITRDLVNRTDHEQLVFG